MAEITKEQLLEFIRNKDLDLDESYPRSDWWKFRDERDSYKKQRDELINDMAETKRKAEAWNKLKEERINDYKKYSNRLEEVWEFDFISRPIENYLGEMEIILQRMDELDGKNEFWSVVVMKINESLKKLEEKGYRVDEDKAIFNLEDGSLEIYIDHDEKTIKTELHDLNVFVSEDLKDRSMESVMYELAGIDEEEQ